MNKKLVKVLIVISVILTIILSTITITTTKISKDERKFRIEYEKYNNSKNLFKEKYMNVNILERNNIKYIGSKEVINILKDGTGIIYLGYPQSSWCRSMIETFLDATTEKNVKTVYYFNAFAIRDEKMLNGEETATIKKGTDNYYKILELLKEKADVYEGLNDDSIKRIYFPTVLFIKDGKIVLKHTSTVSSQKNGDKKLTKKQQKELKKIYIDGINKMNNSCKGKESC